MNPTGAAAAAAELCTLGALPLLLTDKAPVVALVLGSKVTVEIALWIPGSVTLDSDAKGTVGEEVATASDAPGVVSALLATVKGSPHEDVTCAEEKPRMERRAMRRSKDLPI